MSGTTYNKFPEIAANLKPAARRIVRRAAKAIKEEASNNAPVDTGLLSRSIYTTGAGASSTYSSIVPEAKLTKDKNGFSSRRRIQNYVKRKARQRKQEALLFPEIPPPPEDTAAYVVVAATYGAFVELGTRKMAAQPYFYPAVEIGRASIEVAAANFEGDLIGGVEIL